jgi:hypothetical protein
MADADYQANGPPPSPNPGPAKEESSPVNPPATVPSSSASKEKHALEHTPASIPSTSGLCVDKSSVVMKKRSMSGRVTLVAANLIHRASKVVSRIAGGDWYGWRRRNVEELMSTHNLDFDHSVITRWSRAEINRMQAWSKGVHLRME